MRSRHSQLLCITSGTVHPSIFAQLALIAWVRRLPGIRAHVVHDVDALGKLSLERFSAILLYFHSSHISDGALAALDAYLAGGGGLVALHSASASFKETPAYFSLLGGRFLRHGPIASYTIRQTSALGSFVGGGATPEHRGEHPARSTTPRLAPDFRRMESFTLRDELYIHEYDPDNYVHFVVDTEDGPEPIAWSRLHGRGRVFYLAPGHRTETVRHPAVRNILRQGIRWAIDRDAEA
ncbi:MAG TPA: ThuA domain-containing protein [Spirochaetia bacterium]|nr:ThuA domain-containing protein [Spirochaetia bacterium]